MARITLLIALISCLMPISGQRYLGHRSTDSGGPLLPEQAAYDVAFYDIHLQITPDKRMISGHVDVKATVRIPMEWLVLDLDHRLAVGEVSEIAGGQVRRMRFERRGNRIWVHLLTSRQPGAPLHVRIYYEGHPKEAPAPPWVGGFTWERTTSGAHWIATSMQFDGADLWIPCKDHPSDEPDSVGIHITVPRPLYVASNGKLRDFHENPDNTTTYHWHHSNPINNYNIALNIAPYEILETTYQSAGGETVPVFFYALPEHRSRAEAVFPQLREHLAFLEKILGPYPFRSDKYAVAETPHLGMEHQTIIAYGRYENNRWGYDELHHHELAHEWWGNLVTALDWRDFWIHEGFCAYMQALYNEELLGEAAYHEFLERSRSLARNITTLAPRESRSVAQVYFVAPEFIESDGDIYTKGALVLHTLRYLVGDEVFFRLIRRFAYPDEKWERRTDGSQCRFATTDDFLHLAQEVSGLDLDWYFEVYLRQPVLPSLVVETLPEGVRLSWRVPHDLPFPMPLDVHVGGKVSRIVPTPGGSFVNASEGIEIRVDPRNWVYKTVIEE